MRSLRHKFPLPKLSRIPFRIKRLHSGMGRTTCLAQPGVPECRMGAPFVYVTYCLFSQIRRSVMSSSQDATSSRSSCSRKPFRHDSATHRGCPLRPGNLAGWNPPLWRSPYVVKKRPSETHPPGPRSEDYGTSHLDASGHIAP